MILNIQVNAQNLGHLIKKHKQLLVNEIKIWMSRYDEIIKSKKLNELTTFLHENYFSCNGLKRVLFDGE